jgi:hypothetical protein
MEKIDQILAKSLAKKGLSKVTQGAMICFYASEWNKDLFCPISFTNGILKVSVDSSPAASELQIRESELIEYLNNRIGKKSVRQLRIIVLRKL